MQQGSGLTVWSMIPVRMNIEIILAAPSPFFHPVYPLSNGMTITISDVFHTLHFITLLGLQGLFQKSQVILVAPWWWWSFNNGMTITKGNVFPFFTSVFQTVGIPVFLGSRGMLRSVDTSWLSGQPIGSIFKGLLDPWRWGQKSV
jgi:hypothetical protein